MYYLNKSRYWNALLLYCNRIMIFRTFSTLLTCLLCLGCLLSFSHAQMLELCKTADKPEPIEALLDSGWPASGEAQDSQLDAILHYLYRNEALPRESLIPLSEKLLAAGCPMNQGAFIAACVTNDAKLIEFCLLHGAKPDGDENSTPPLSVLCLYSPECILGELDDDATEEELAAAKLKQAESNRERLECIRVLLEHGAQVNGASADYPTHLNCASATGFTDGMALLISYGADVNKESAGKISPLHDACDPLSNLDAVKLLVEHGAHINSRSLDNCTPLMFACALGKIEVVEYLLAQGADAEAWSRPTPGFEEERRKRLWIRDDLEQSIPLPSLLFSFTQEVSDQSFSIFWLVFKAQSIWVQLAYLLAALLLMLSPFLLLALLIWGVVTVIRKFKKRNPNKAR